MMLWSVTEIANQSLYRRCPRSLPATGGPCHSAQFAVCAVRQISGNLHVRSAIPGAVLSSHCNEELAPVTRDEILAATFMPLAGPSYPKGPYRFTARSGGLPKKVGSPELKVIHDTLTARLRCRAGVAARLSSIKEEGRLL
jgi:hypothetical protein